MRRLRTWLWRHGFEELGVRTLVGLAFITLIVGSPVLALFALLVRGLVELCK
jgi:hypothetical protein